MEEFLRDGKDHLFTLAINQSSPNKRINELTIFDSNNTKLAILNSITAAYRNAPFYKAHFQFLSDIILSPEKNLSRYLCYGLRQLAGYLNLNARIIISSQIPMDKSLTGQDRVIDMCKALGTTTYINPIGGIELYMESAFRKEAIDLRFIKCQSEPYQQFDSTFIPQLSIIDVLMFNQLDRIQEYLLQFELIGTMQAKQ